MDLSTFTLSHRIDWTPRPDRASPRYHRRLANARLTKSELKDIDVLYGILDEERAAEGLPPAERAFWSPADILEWRDMNDVEKYLDLKTFARAADRATATRPISRAA